MNGVPDVLFRQNLLGGIEGNLLIRIYKPPQR